MGRKNIRSGNHIFLCITVVILLLSFSCASLNDMHRKRYTNEIFLRSEKLLAEKDFNSAITENRKVLSLYVKGPPGDQALFNIAMIHTHYGNPDRNYGKAQILFRQLIQNYPDSDLLEQSKNWETILDRSVKMQLSLQEKADALNQFIRAKEGITHNNFAVALKANDKILSLSDKGLSKDKALYNIALIYAHYENPARSYKKTLQYFSRLIKEYPDSPYSEEAKIWRGVIRAIEQTKQVDIEIEKKKKEMAR